MLCSWLPFCVSCVGDDHRPPPKPVSAESGASISRDSTDWALDASQQSLPVLEESKPDQTTSHRLWDLVLLDDFFDHVVDDFVQIFLVHCVFLSWGSVSAAPCCVNHRWGSFLFSPPAFCCVSGSWPRQPPVGGLFFSPPPAKDCGKRRNRVNGIDTNTRF